MSKITNLNHVRKSKARADKRAKARVNATKFGRTKAEKRLDETRVTRADRDLDGHKRDD